MKKYTPSEIKHLKEIDKNVVWHPFTQMKDWEAGDPVIIAAAEGTNLIDIEGKSYIDGVSSLWVNTFGHRVPELDQAVTEQLKRIAHSTLLGLGNVPAAEYAAELVKVAPGDLSRVFYSDSGSTAVEIALKIAFQYCQQTGRASKTKFVSFINGYHGDTIGSVSLGGIDLFHQIYHPLLFQTYKAPYPYCYRCPLETTPQNCGLACAEKLEKILAEDSDKIAGVVIEPMVQGAAGMVTAPPGFLTKVRQLCDGYDVLLIADEVATGFGRTGKMFACEHEDVKPDLMAVAKGITGGYLPLAATLATDEIYQGFYGEVEEKITFFHGHTYTGNPLACAAAIATLKYFKDNKIIEKMQPRIERMTDRLSKIARLEHVGDARQIGLMVGIELVADKQTKAEYAYADQMAARVCAACRPHGLIIRNLGDVVILMPPLVIEEKQLDRMLQIVHDAIVEVTE